MEPLTKQDLLEALQPLTTDVRTLKADVGTLKAGVVTLTSDVGAVKTDVRAIRRDVKLIHEDLKAHDLRAEETNAKINELLELKKIETQIQQIRENIRQKLGVEV